MSYSKTTWQDGDVITAEKLNKLETGVSEIEIGYEVSENTTILFEGNITTVSNDGMYSGEITLTDPRLSSITLILDENEYTLNRYIVGGNLCYSETEPTLDSTPPVPSIVYLRDNFVILTSEEKTYATQVKFTETVVTNSSDFQAAVNHVALTCIMDQSDTLNHTWNEINDTPIVILRQESTGAVRIGFKTYTSVTTNKAGAGFIYTVDFITSDTSHYSDCLKFTTDDPDGYPQYK